MPNHREERVSMSRRQEFDANKLLEQHLRKTPGSEGMYEYEAEWSDARVAETIGYNGKWAQQVIARLRCELFGKLAHKNPAGGVPNVVLAQKVEEQNRRIVALEASINDMAIRFDKLCTSLSLHKVLDVRHLSKEQKSAKNGAAASA